MTQQTPGKRLKQVRTDLQLNQTQMAKLLKTAKATLVDLENNGYSERETDDDDPRRSVVNTLLGIEKLLAEAKGGNEQASQFINRTYEAFELSMRWAPGIGPITLNAQFGFLAAGIASAITGHWLVTPQEHEWHERVRLTHEAFKRYDLDGNGSIDFEEFKTGLGWESAEEAHRLFKALDLNHNDVLTVGELLNAPVEQPIWEILNGKYKTLAAITIRQK